MSVHPLHPLRPADAVAPSIADPSPGATTGASGTHPAAGATVVDSPVRAARTSRRGRGRLLQPVMAVLSAVLLLGVPFWLMISTAAKDRAEALEPDLSPPTSWHLLANVTEVVEDGRMVRAFLGSVLVMVPSVVIVLVLGSMAAWVLARRSTRPMAVVYAICISGIVLPPAVVTIVLLLRQIGIAGTPLGMVGVYCGMYLSTVIFFVTGFVRSIPHELEEAARVDGASPTRVFFQVVLPMLKPVLATATILICLYIWNDVFYALFVIGGRLDTLPLNLYQVASAGLYLQNWHLIFAYVIVMTLPLLAVFVVAQRRVISGITGGAVK